jgi:hypothetical protein
MGNFWGETIVEVDCASGNFEDQLARARLEIMAANDPTHLYSYATKPERRPRPVRVIDGRPQFLSEHDWRTELSRLIQWKGRTKGGLAPWGIVHVTFGEAGILLPPYTQ